MVQTHHRAVSRCSVARVDGSEVQGGTVAEPTASSTRVCIIDDHDMMADALALALDLAGIHVVGRAGTVADGLALIDLVDHDVLVCDFDLPDGDALAIIRRVAAAHPQLRVIVVTSLVDPSIAAEALAAGATGYLTKDQPLVDLVTAIRAAATGTTVIAPRLIGDMVTRLRRPQARLGDDLTNRERQALRLLALGNNVALIATSMDVSRNTARKYVQGVLDKMHAHTQLEAVAIARREGVLRDLDRATP
jgi:DNA-binding NarL/FixJ family response regulator